ncbi:MAG: ATP-binding protein [Bacteroidota bacterium]
MTLLNHLLSQRYYNSIPEDDLISKQRYKLFRTTSWVGFLVCLLFTVQTVSISNISNSIVFMVTAAGTIFVANLYLLPVHKSEKVAYSLMVLVSLLFLHVQSYFSGGIRASGIFYLSSLIMLGFMLLGNRRGWMVAALSGIQVIYFYIISSYYPSLINYMIVGDTKALIDMDFLFTGLFSIVIITAQINYLESGKNIVIERITQSRNELREKNKELRKLSIVASKADNAIGIINHEGILEWVNDGFVRLTGYSMEEVTGKDPFLFFDNKDSDKSVLAAMKTAMHEKQNFVSEILKYHKNGTRYWTQITITPIITDDKSETKYIFIESNITTRKIAEEKMKHYLANLEKSNAELDKFAYVVSHDLKAPLRAIGNLTGWIEEDIGDKLPADSVTHFNTIKNRVVRMEGLINGILDYTKANKNGGAEEAFKCDDLLRETIDLLGVPDNAIINIRQGMPLMKTEKVKLQQVFMNIINNAIRYNDKEDIQVDIGFEDKGNDWQFYVKDNGPGIEPRYHDKIFVIFQTLNARDELESRGVGLAIVKKLIEDEGGKIWVESDAGMGAKFCFTWPKMKRKTAVDLLMPEFEAI